MLNLGLDRLIREARPTGGVYGLHSALAEESLPDPVIVCAKGVPVAVSLFERLAPKLAYGSVFVLWEAGAAEVAHIDSLADKIDFRNWTGAPGTPEGAAMWVKSHWDGNTYASHVPYLLEAVRRTTGPVLELGSGDGSTPALHEACAASGRLLVTVDSDLEWLSKFKSMASERHRLIHSADPAETQWLEHEWGVVFVDHAPGHTRRRAIERARNRADLILVHDSEELGYNLEDLLASFKYRTDFRFARPWTTVVSERLEVWK